MKHINSKKGNTCLKDVIQTEFQMLLNKKCKTDSYEQGTNKCPPSELSGTKNSDDFVKRTVDKAIDDHKKSKTSEKTSSTPNIKSSTTIMKTGPDSAKIYVKNPEGEGTYSYGRIIR